MRHGNDRRPAPRGADTGAAARRAAVAALALLLAAGCGDARTPATQRADPAPGARRVAALDSARWTLADSTIAGALALAADDSTVYLLGAGGRLAALDARDGAQRWTLATAEDDAASSRAPGGATAIARTALGNLALLDGRARRVTAVGAEGRVRERVALPPGDEPSQLCARADGSMLVAGGDARGRLVALQPTGAFDWTLALPWPDADTLSALQLQAALATAPDGHACVAALRLGRGFAVVRDGIPPRVAATTYLEPVALPPVQVVERQEGTTTTTMTTLADAPAAAAAVTIAGGTVAVAFEGATAERHRVIDLFALDAGTYRGSLLHGAPIVAIAGWDTRLYVLHRRRGRFALAAYDVPALRDGVAADAPVRSLAPAATRATVALPRAPGTR
jgi:outer membrane protein assembly factor BamB